MSWVGVMTQHRKVGADENIFVNKHNERQRRVTLPHMAGSPMLWDNTFSLHRYTRQIWGEASERKQIPSQAYTLNLNIAFQAGSISS